MSTRWPHKIVLGLTGNIATGKSAVLEMARAKGALTLDADAIVHEILRQDRGIQAAIAAAFGSGVRATDGTIDRAALAEIVFSDDEALAELEKMLHPAVRRVVVERIDDSKAGVILIEAIKLLEGGLAALCDQVWVTDCPRPLQIQRLVICRGMDAETAALRVKAQNPQQAKVAQADVVISTDGTMAATREQVERAWSRLPAPQPAPDEVREEAPAVAEPMTAEVVVRRARPPDIPALILHIQKATGNAVQMTRRQMLLSFSERSYLIGQVGTTIHVILGWNTDSTTAVCVDQFYAHPFSVLPTVGPPLLEEVEASARELICEVVLVFLPHDVPDPILRLLTAAGYTRMNVGRMPRAWQQTVLERQPHDTFIVGKVMRDIRVR
jgi:dephospho-CoA kinase